MYQMTELKEKRKKERKKIKLNKKWNLLVFLMRYITISLLRPKNLTLKEVNFRSFIKKVCLKTDFQIYENLFFSSYP